MESARTFSSAHLVPSLTRPKSEKASFIVPEVTLKRLKKQSRKKNHALSIREHFPLFSQYVNIIKGKKIS